MGFDYFECFVGSLLVLSCLISISSLIIISLSDIRSSKAGRKHHIERADPGGHSVGQAPEGSVHTSGWLRVGHSQPGRPPRGTSS